MACNVFDGFRSMTEHLNPELYSRLRMQDYWLELVDRTTYTPNTGYEQTVFTLTNVEPASVTPSWSSITPVSDSVPGGPCTISYDDVQWGFDERVYAPEQKGYRGPILCKDEFTFDYLTDEFINHYIEQLAFVTRRVWSNRLQEHYLSLSNKYICGYGNTFFPGATLAPTAAQATLPAVRATSQLTQDMLDVVAYQLIHSGANATQPDAKGYITLGPEGPIFPLLIGLEMSKQITLQSAASQYQGLLWSGAGAGEGSQLMKNVGATKVLFNYRHIPCMFPPRFEWNGAAYVRVEPFLIEDADGKGKKATLNPDWTNAAYEAAFVLHPLVMRTEIVQPEVNAGGLPFDPTNYYGDWQFVTGAYRIFDSATACVPDPKDKFGRHFAEFKHAVRPILPDYGYTFIFKRCINTPLTVTCS